MRTRWTCGALLTFFAFTVACSPVYARKWYPHTGIQCEITTLENGEAFPVNSEVTCTVAPVDVDKRVEGGVTTYPNDTFLNGGAITWLANDGAFKNDISSGTTVTWVAPAGPRTTVTIGVVVRDDAVIPPGEDGTRDDDEDAFDQVTIGVFGGEIAGDTADLYLLYPTSSSPALTYTRQPGQPTGTSYEWAITVGDDCAHIQGGDTGQTVDVQGDAPSGSGAVTLSLTYSHSNRSWAATKALTVHKPTRPYSTRQIDAQATIVGWSCRRYVHYYSLSQHGLAMRDILWDETVWPMADDPGVFSPYQGDRNTNPSGYVRDEIGWGYYQWNGTATMNGHFGQTIRIGGWHSETNGFWQNQLYWYETPDIVVAPSN